MWTGSTIVLQCINSTNKNPIFFANHVCEILENTSVDQWNHVATCDNPADAGTRGMSAEVLQSSSWVSGSDFLRTKQFPFVPNTDVVDNIKLGVVTKEQDDDSISSLVASVTKPPKEQSINLIPFDKFNSYQKLLRVTAYVLPLLPSHGSYRTVDGSIADPVELDEAERHQLDEAEHQNQSTWFKKSRLIPKAWIFLTTNPLRGAAALLRLLHLLGLMASSALLVDSDG